MRPRTCDPDSIPRTSRPVFGVTSNAAPAPIVRPKRNFKSRPMEASLNAPAFSRPPNAERTGGVFFDKREVFL